MAFVPPSSLRIYLESMLFRGPVSEEMLQAVGGVCNFLLDAIIPVGSIQDTMLTEAQFQTEISPGGSQEWILADGRAVAGSRYATLVGPNVPDLRGVVRRGKNYARDVNFGNASGDLPVGTQQSDQNQLHGHTLTDPGHVHTFQFSTSNEQDGNNPSRMANTNEPETDTFSANTVGATTGITLATQGGNEVRMRSVTVNVMIRIN